MDSPPAAARARACVSGATDIEAELERLRAQLETLRTPPDLSAAVGRLLADPASLRALARQLGGAVCGSPELRGMLIEAARRAADTLDDANGGYPDLSEADSPVAPDDSAAGLSGDEESSLGGEESSSGEVSEDDSSEAESSGCSTEGSAAEAAEAAIEDAAARDRLLDLQDQLSDLEDDWLRGRDVEMAFADAAPAPAPGGRAGGPPAAKRPRLDAGEAPLGAVEVELALVEARVGWFEAERERTESAAEALLAACETYNYLGGEACAAVARAEQRLEAYLEAPDRPSAGARAALLAELAAVRAELDRFAGGCPARKRRRDEREALDEIRAEQRRTDEVIDRGAFARLVREVGSAAVGAPRRLGDFRSGLDGFRVEADAIAALQAAAEDHLVRALEAANRAAMHAGRTHIDEPDIRFAGRGSR